MSKVFLTIGPTEYWIQCSNHFLSYVSLYKNCKLIEIDTKHNQQLWQYDNWFWLKFVPKITPVLMLITCYFLPPSSNVCVIRPNVKYVLAHSFCQILIKIVKVTKHLQFLYNRCNFFLRTELWSITRLLPLLQLTEIDLKWFNSHTVDLLIITSWKWLIALLH